MRFQITHRIRALQSLLCLNARYSWAVACVELAAVKFAIFAHSRRNGCHSATLDIQIGPARCHWVTFSIEVDIDFRDRSPSTILTFIVESLTFPLPEGLLFHIVKFRVSIQSCTAIRVIVCLRTHLKETFLCVESWWELFSRVFLYNNRVELFRFVIWLLVHHWFLWSTGAWLGERTLMLHRECTLIVHGNTILVTVILIWTTLMTCTDTSTCAAERGQLFINLTRLRTLPLMWCRNQILSSQWLILLGILSWHILDHSCRW